MRLFKYLRPHSLSEVYELMDSYQDEAKVIAGGQTLMILLKERLISPTYLIDIKNLSELRYIESDNEGGLKIGALSTHRDIEFSPLVKKDFRILAEMEKRVASIQVRNWGTIGGNLSHADPNGDPASPLIALGATVTLGSSQGKRELLLEDFFHDYFETALATGELLTEIKVPKIPPLSGVAYQKFSYRDMDSTLIGVAVFLRLNGTEGTVQGARIVLGGAGSTPLRIEKAEAILMGTKVDNRASKAAGKKSSEVANPVSDIHGSEAYKREIIKVIVERTAEEAFNRATKTR